MATDKPKKMETEFKTEGGDTVKLHVHHPSAKDSEAAGLEYSRVYSELFRDKTLLLSQEVAKAAKDRGLWGKEQQEEEARLSKEIAEAERVVSGKVRGTTKKQGREAAVKLFRLRSELQALDGALGSLEANTVERKAGEARWDVLVSRCTSHADSGKLYFTSKADVAGRPDDDPAKAAASEALMRLTLGYDPEGSFAKRPEVAFMLKYGFGKMDGRRLVFVDPKTGQEVDDDGNPVVPPPPDEVFEFEDE